MAPTRRPRGREYVEALATGTVTSIGRMAELAGSPAELARYQLAAARYWGGGPPSTTEVRDDEIEVCDDDPTVGELTCTVFGAFEVDADGLLVTFSTDGSPIDDRLRAGDPAGVGTEGVSVVVLTSYLTSRGDLVVVVDVTNNRGEVIEVDDCSATYVGPDGRQVTQQCGSMLPQVQPGDDGVAYVFEQVTGRHDDLTSSPTRRVRSRCSTCRSRCREAERLTAGPDRRRPGGAAARAAQRSAAGQHVAQGVDLGLVGRQAPAQLGGHPGLAVPAPGVPGRRLPLGRVAVALGPVSRRRHRHQRPGSSGRYPAARRPSQAPERHASASGTTWSMSSSPGSSVV